MPRFASATPRRIARRGFREAVQRSRVWKYRALSTATRVTGAPVVLQPVLFLGSGAIVIGDRVEFGWPSSVAFYSGYGHVEATAPGSLIEIGDDVQINNNAFIKSEGPGIRIGRAALIGSYVEIFDSDFHELHPDRRRGGTPRWALSSLERTSSLETEPRSSKGSMIGAASVVGAGSVVTSSIPAGVIAAGNPRA